MTDEAQHRSGEDKLRDALRKTARGTGAVAVKAALALALWEGAEIPEAVQVAIRSIAPEGE